MIRDLSGIATDARIAREHIRQAATSLERVRTGAAADTELCDLAAATIEAADHLLVRVGELRHAMASRALVQGYRGP